MTHGEPWSQCVLDGVAVTMPIEAGEGEKVWNRLVGSTKQASGFFARRLVLGCDCAVSQPNQSTVISQIAPS
jgi:hypothetical protein